MNKPTKSKEELRSLILSEIAGQPVCPPGMDVSIEATEGDGWRALSVPPGNIAYADCAHFMGTIAQRLRSEYDLLAEAGPTIENTSDAAADPPASPPSMPPLGWSNASDDAANRVVQGEIGRRRRFVAAISSGTVEPIGPATSNATPPGPFSATFPGPFEPTFPGPFDATRPGAFDAGASDASSFNAIQIDFSNPDERERWLKTQTYEVAVVLAARAALRVLPATPPPGRESGSARMLRVFRAVSAAWAVAAYPSHHSVFRNSAKAALFSSVDLRLPPSIRSVRSAVFASGTASTDDEMHTATTTAIGYALDAAGSKGGVAFDLTMKAITADADLLGQRFNPATIAYSQLWPNHIPEWVVDSWDKLRLALLNENLDWEVWTQWYDERLVGAIPDQDREVARASIPNDIWEKGPKIVNAQLKLMLKEREVFEHATTDEADMPGVEAIPQQATSASRFALDAEGRIDLVPDPPSHAPLADPVQREMYQEMQHKALALAGLGHNQLAGLLSPVDRFRTALPDDMAHASLNRLWSRGNTLRRYLKAHEIAAMSGEPSDPARLSSAVAGLLHDVVETFNVFIVGDPQGRELDQVRLGPQERHAAQAIMEAALPIAEAVQASEGLATPTAVEALTDQIASARDAPVGVDGDQAVDLSRKTTSNFVAEALRVAYAPIRKVVEAGKSEVSFGWKEVRAGTYRYAGPAGIGAGYLYRHEIIAFVVDNASSLKVFVEQAFSNPELVRIIDMIVQAAARM